MDDFRRRIWQVAAVGLLGLLGIAGCSESARATSADGEPDVSHAIAATRSVPSGATVVTETTPTAVAQASESDRPGQAPAVTVEAAPVEITQQATVEEPKSKPGRQPPRRGGRGATTVKKSTAEKPATVEPAAPKADDNRKVAWDELNALMKNFKGCRYRPTRRDYDGGDQKLAEKLSSLREELKGQEVVAMRNMVDHIMSGREQTGPDVTDVGVNLLHVESLFERLGEVPKRSDRKVSWEKLEAMLAGLPVRITRKDWEAGDQSLVAKLKQSLDRLEARELEIMQRNAYQAATTGGEINLDSLFSAGTTQRHVEQVIKEFQRSDQAEE